MEKKKYDIDKALKTVVLDTLVGMKDINDISCYEFNIFFKLNNKFRLKGVVRVEIDDIEEVE